MKRVRDLLFGVGMLAVLASGVSAAWAQPGPPERMRLCGKETTEGGCQTCCSLYGLNYGWGELGCACTE
jgi:hypothetical protein